MTSPDSANSCFKALATSSTAGLALGTAPEDPKIRGLRHHHVTNLLLNQPLPKRIGLKPLPLREKLKSDYSLLQSSSF